MCCASELTDDWTYYMGFNAGADLSDTLMDRMVSWIAPILL